jgi:hypothetical protein
MCEVKEKTWGKRAGAFMIKIVIIIRMIVISLLFSVFIIVNFTSFFSFTMIALIKILKGSSMWCSLLTNNKGKTMNRSHGDTLIEELGSNTEKRFIIICFVCFFLLRLLI